MPGICPRSKSEEDHPEAAIALSVAIHTRIFTHDVLIVLTVVLD